MRYFWKSGAQNDKKEITFLNGRTNTYLTENVSEHQMHRNRSNSTTFEFKLRDTPTIKMVK